MTKRSEQPCARSREERSAAAAHITGIDLFCGVGGLTHGLIRGGIRITAGIDVDATCKFPYEANNDAVFLQKDVRTLKASDIQPFLGSDTIRLIAGCAPCQPFSTYSQKCRRNGDDRKWDLLLDFGRIVDELQPELVTMENVPQLLGHKVFEKFLVSLSGYHLWHNIVECAAYGVPQTRKRLVLLASRLGPVELMAPTHSGRPVTLRTVISQLPRLSAGKHSLSDPLHAACSLSKLNLRRIKASRPGGTWRDWPPTLRAKCHRRKSGQTYPSVYGRMEWGGTAPTITTQCFGFGNGRFGHPEQNRAISLREAAIIQTFPNDYRFIPGNSTPKFNVLGRLIGNAVPVRLGEVVAETLTRHVQTLGTAVDSPSRGNGEAPEVTLSMGHLRGGG